MRGETVLFPHHPHNTDRVVPFMDRPQVAAWEAITLFFMYCIYVTIMAYNESLEVWVTNHVKKSEENQTPMQKTFIIPFRGLGC